LVALLIDIEHKFQILKVKFLTFVISQWHISQIQKGWQL